MLHFRIHHVMGITLLVDQLARCRGVFLITRDMRCDGQIRENA